MTRLPVPTSPVSETLATAGWRTSSSPARASPWTTLKTPSGTPASVYDLGEQRGGERRQLGGLEDHRVAAGERRRRFPARDLDRVVPRADADADAERLAARVGERALQLVVLAVERRRETAVVLEAVGAGQHVDHLGFLDRLAGVAHFDLGDLAIALAQDPGSAVEDAPALRAGHRRPDVESGFGRGDRLLDFRDAGLLDAAEDLTGGRIDVVERFSGGAAHVASADVALLKGQGLHGGVMLTRLCRMGRQRPQCRRVPASAGTTNILVIYDNCDRSVRNFVRDGPAPDGVSPAARSRSPLRCMAAPETGRPTSRNCCPALDSDVAI